MEESYNDSEYASGRIFRKLDIFIWKLWQYLLSVDIPENIVPCGMAPDRIKKCSMFHFSFCEVHRVFIPDQIFLLSMASTYNIFKGMFVDIPCKSLKGHHV
jgi:hypothetical protein